MRHALNLVESWVTCRVAIPRLLLYAIGEEPACVGAVHDCLNVRTAAWRNAASRSRPCETRSGKSTSAMASITSSRPGCAIQTAWPGSRAAARSGAQWRVVNGHDVLRSYLVPDTLGSVCDGGCYGPTAATARRSINASSRSGPSWCPATSAMCCGA